MAAAAIQQASGKADVTDKVLNQLNKTTLCNWFKKSKKCPNGDSCPFAHGVQELRKRPNLKKTSLCKAWQAGCCPKKAPQCFYAHGYKDKRETLDRTMGALVSPKASQSSGSIPEHKATTSVRTEGMVATSKTVVSLSSTEERHASDSSKSEVENSDAPVKTPGAKPFILQRVTGKWADMSDTESEDEEETPRKSSAAATGKQSGEDMRRTSPMTAKGCPNKQEPQALRASSACVLNIEDLVDKSPVPFGGPSGFFGADHCGSSAGLMMLQPASVCVMMPMMVPMMFPALGGTTYPAPCMAGGDYGDYGASLSLAPQGDQRQLHREVNPA